MSVQLNGGHLFSAFFPLYCEVATAGLYNIAKYAVDDYFFVSVNGGSFNRDPYALQLNAGVNRVVIFYGNGAWSGAYLHFSVQGISQWYHPASLDSCEGKRASICIPNIPSVGPGYALPAFGTSAQPLAGINGLIYYHGCDRSGDVVSVAPDMPVFSKFDSESSFPDILLPAGASRFVTPASQFNFWTDVRPWPRSGGSVEWPDIKVVFLPPIITAGQTGSGAVGTVFSKTFSLTDSANRPATSWTATGLPTWATLDAITGAITGTPTAIGSTTVTLAATGPGGTSAATTATISIAVGPPIITAGQSFTLKVGEAFTQTPALDDELNRPATSWSANGLPSWATLNATTGAITGTPHTIMVAWLSVVLEATGPGGKGPATTVLIKVASGAPIITVGQTASGAVGTTFSKTFSLTDSANRPATSWTATGLPTWATLDAITGAITGTPTAIGSTTVTLAATGPGGTSAATTATISIAVGPPIITAGQTFAGKVGDVFSATTLALTDAVNRPATSWGGTGLPAGLAINATTGAITGTPTTAGAFTANFTATGGGGTGAATSVAFTISEGAPIITAGQTLSGGINISYSRTPALTDASNRPATAWLATGLPGWATLNATTGEITGTPTTSGNATITLTATGPGGTSAATTVTISITPALVVEWPGVKLKVGEVVRFFAVTGSLPSGVTAGVDYYVSQKVSDFKFTIASSLAGAVIVSAVSSWTGTYKVQLKSRVARGASTPIAYIGMKPSDGPEWDSDANSINLWGYDNTSSTTVSRLLKAEDIEYADMVATDWVITMPGGVAPSAGTLGSGTLRTLVINHEVKDGVYFAEWPEEGVLVDLEQSPIGINGAVGELKISPLFAGNIEISMLSWLAGVQQTGNLCSLYMRFFNSHNDADIDLCRQGKGTGWIKAISFGAPWDVASRVIVPVTGAYVVYKIEHEVMLPAPLSVSLKINIIK